MTPGQDLLLKSEKEIYLNDKPVSAPAQSRDIRISNSKQKLEIDHVQFTLTISGNEVVLKYLKNLDFNGLCGTNDELHHHQMVNDQFIQVETEKKFLTAWSIGAAVSSAQNVKNSKAMATCEKLFQLESFRECRREIQINSPKQMLFYLEHCHSQIVSNLNEQDNPTRYCESLDMFSRECTRKGLTVPQWWSEEFCPHQCPLTQFFSTNGPGCLKTCSKINDGEFCQKISDGCRCQEGKLLQDIKGGIGYGTCVAADACPCVHNGIPHHDQEVITNQGCEECTCQKGKWDCHAAANCEAECTVGSPTGLIQFDGRVLPIKNDCTYLVSKTSSWRITAHMEHVFTQPSQVRFLEVNLGPAKQNSIILELGPGCSILSSLSRAATRPYRHC